jgi:PAS domain S-box-containing protein
MKNKDISTADGLADMLTDCSIDAIISINRDWAVTAWNKTAEIITGVSKEAAMEQQLLTVIPSIEEDKESLLAIQQAFLGFRSFIPPSDFFSHRVHLENYYIPLRDLAGVTVGVMNIIHDVAHRVKAEQRLQALHAELKENYTKLQQTTAELANFTLISSNNIKGPIRNIYTTIEQLIKTESGNLSDNGRAAFRRIQTSVNKMNLLLDNMLELAQIGMGEKIRDAIDLGREIKEVLDTMAGPIQENNVKVVVKSLCTIAGSKEQIRVLFKQLFSNAIKFNESPAPLITVEYEKTSMRTLHDGSILTREYNCITVTDNGIGLAATDKDRIFNMFEKVDGAKRYKGAGTGLAIARKIMAAHDGIIQVNSTPGKGSAFQCFFPVL